MSVFPKSSVSQSKNNALVWVYRKEIPTDFLLSKNSETGVIYYSNAELTALDIVQYEQYIGGLSRAATIQRLGYILDEILNAEEIADTLYMELTSYVKRFKYIPLTINKPKDCAERNNRWKIFVNTIIETDEI